MSLLIPILTLAAANPVFVRTVNADVHEGRYEMRIEGEAPLDPADVKGRIEGRRITLYVEGGRARSENRAWGHGELHVRAFRHKERLELEGRLPASGCAGGVSVVAAGQGGVIARVSCATGPGDVSATEVPPPRTEGVAAAPPPLAKTHDESLLQAVALPPPPVAEAPVLPAPERNPPAKATVAEAVPAAAAVASPSTGPKAPAAAAGAAPQASLWGAALKALFPILLLGGVAWVGLKVSRRRRGLGRHVRIMETTPLGPRRSLIVAKVGNETLLLGASEAGIALIQVRTNDAKPAEEGDELPGGSRVDEAPEGSWLDVMPGGTPEGDEAPEAGQVKLLSRLFRKRRRGLPESWPFANVLDASLLEDSSEDRELREKLALGMEARVP